MRNSLKNLDELYSGSIEWGLERAKNSKTIALGLHSVIDGLVRIEPQKFERETESIAYEKNMTIPDSIKRKEDFLNGLAFSFVNGSALQLMIDSEEVYGWIMDKFGSGTLRLGGTSANMASSLSGFPFPKILVYAYPLTEDLAKLFGDGSENLFAVGRNGKIVSPKAAFNGTGVRAIHWIFEFSEGQKMKIGNREYKCPRSNRFIASWNPVNSRLEIREPFRSYVIDHAGEISKFLLSGFHIMRDLYPNGETASDRMDDLVEFISAARRKNPSIQFHIEFASIRRDGVRRAVEKKLFPVSDSLGANEVELSWIAKDLGMDPEGIEKRDVEKISEVLLKLIKMGLKRVHFHTLGFYLVAFDGEKYDPETELKALAFAATAAAQRARDADLDPGKLKEIIDIPVSDFSYHEWTTDGMHFILFPTKIVPNPKLTVGLGDTISSIGFVLG